MRKPLSKKLKNWLRNSSLNLKKASQQTFVTQHTAFSYLAKRFGLNQLGIAGISPESIAAVKTHGIGTADSDAAELAALEKIFGTLPPLMASNRKSDTHLAQRQPLKQPCFYSA